MLKVVVFKKNGSWWVRAVDPRLVSGLQKLFLDSEFQVPDSGGWSPESVRWRVKQAFRTREVGVESLVQKASA